ncbi:ImmA/IrrE family metallo-endopeptidase [Gimesia sp.]|uniref:ImmA/IrrE family metallo-endopeptidase n=1 Tax=Gimesia sp. TaxID=2024833 RepID=UPI003A956FFC|tara:strand:- start:28839 stop:29717 length:879 start_codon:yes stop_codon:yes gene_type:complete
MADSVDWKQIYSARQHATEEGERIALAYEFYTPPVDPLRIIHAERRLIHAVGDDFGNAFDGRIKYIGPRFLICYNTRYNAWPHIGCHHSKVLFTICHELGHYFIEEHRKILVSTCTAHGSQTEFVSDLLIEQQADCFASGLLMPSRLFRPHINSTNFPTIDKIKQIRRSFQVSLIGMLVRWTQLSDFPCATIAINDGVIQFGWASEEFRRIGAYRIRRGEEVEGREMQRFARQDPTFSKYREGSGTGAVINWIDYDQKRLDTMEHYFAIPYTKTIWVFLFVDENDFPESDFY